MIARHHVVALDANSNCESATWCFFWGGHCIVACR